MSLLILSCSTTPNEWSRYVAMHTIQENDASSSGEDSHSNGYMEVNQERTQSRPDSQKKVQLVAAAVAGMLLPLITQIGHAH